MGNHYSEEFEKFWASSPMHTDSDRHAAWLGWCAAILFLKGLSK